MPDRFEGHFNTLAGEYTHAAAVTPSDTVDLPETSRALIFTGAGNLSVVMASGAAVLFTAPSPGVPLRIRARRVRATGTTVTNIVALV